MPNYPETKWKEPTLIPVDFRLAPFKLTEEDLVAIKKFQSDIDRRAEEEVQRLMSH